MATIRGTRKYKKSRKNKSLRKKGGAPNIRIRNPFSNAKNVKVVSPLTTPIAMQEQEDRKEHLLNLVGRHLPMKVAGNVIPDYTINDIIEFNQNGRIYKGIIRKYQQVYEGPKGTPDVLYIVFVPHPPRSNGKSFRHPVITEYKVWEDSVVGKVGVFSNV
jgi:hypothetical protein